MFNRKRNYRIHLESKNIFEKKKKVLSFTYMCAVPALIQSIVYYFIHDSYI